MNDARLLVDVVGVVDVSVAVLVVVVMLVVLVVAAVVVFIGDAKAIQIDPTPFLE